MTQHLHVDMAQVEAQIAEAMEALRPICAENGSRGVQARFSMLIDVAFMRQLSEEINRGTTTDQVSDALAAVCTNMILSLVDSAIGSDADAVEKAQLVNCQLAKISRFLVHRFKGEADEVYSGSIELHRGGRA